MEFLFDRPALTLWVGMLVLCAGGLVLVWRFLRASRLEVSEQVLVWHITGLLVYGGALHWGAQLNPRDMVGGSWTDPYLQGVTVLAFVACAVAPWGWPVPWFARVGIFLANLGMLLGAFSAWYAITA